MHALPLRQLFRTWLLLGLFAVERVDCWTQETAKVSLSGRVCNQLDKTPISGVILLLEQVGAGAEKPHQLAYAQSRSDGTFVLTWGKSKKSGELQLSIRRLGYAPRVLPLRSLAGELTLFLVPQTIRLRSVQVRSPMIRSRGDTTSYSARGLSTAATYTLEDLIKRIPALQVDKHGVIRWGGKPIEGVYIEGMDLLGGRYAVATRNLKAEDIASVDLIERFQKMKVLRGKVLGEGTILNVHLKSGSKLRPVGQVQASSGGEQGLPPEMIYGAKAMSYLARERSQTLALVGANYSGHSIAREGLQQPSEGLLGVTSLIGSVQAEDIEGRAHLGKGNAGATLNGIHQLGDAEHTLRYNLGYEGARLGTYRKEEVRLLDQGASSAYAVQLPTQGRHHLAQALLDYTANTSRYYLQEQLSLDLSAIQRQTDLRRNAERLDFRESQTSFQLRSQTSWAKGTARGGHLKLSGDLQLNALPRLRFHSPTSGHAFDTQLSGYSLQLSGSTQYSRHLRGRWSLAGGLDFLGHYGQLQGGEYIAQSSPYEVLGGGVSIQTMPTLSCLGRRTNLSLSLPLSLLLEGYRYGEADKQVLTPLLRLYPGVSSQLQFVPWPMLRLIAKVDYRAELRRSLATFLLAPLQTSYDQVRDQRELELLSQRSLSAQLALYYRRPLEGFHANLTVGWRRGLSP